jgi:hypothetical protein
MLPLGESGHNPEKFRAISRAQLVSESSIVLGLVKIAAENILWTARKSEPQRTPHHSMW